MTTRSRPLGSGARLRRDRSMLADAQRRFNAAADQDESLKDCPLPDPPPQAGEGKGKEGGGEQAVPGESEVHGTDGCITPLTREARSLYEAGVVPVRALARLCGVSVPGLYYHVRRQGWRRRRSAVPRDPAKSERQRRRYRALQALRPRAPRGMKSRDPAGHADALAVVERAGALSGAALAAAIARQDAEARARIVANLTRALYQVAAAERARAKEARRTERRERGSGKPPRSKRRPWRPMPGS